MYSDPPPRSGGADSWTLGSGAPPPAALTSAIGAVVSQSFEAEGVFDGECVGLSRARDGRWLHQVRCAHRRWPMTHAHLTPHAPRL